jgi:aldehyde dehydrogenase (NAD+)
VSHQRSFYIDGKWVEPSTSMTADVIDPATEEPVATVALGAPADVDAAVDAARRAFETYSRTSVEERAELLGRVINGYRARAADLANAVVAELGAPPAFAAEAQVPAGLGHLIVARKLLSTFAFEERIGSTLVVHEPIGVCALVTPWNWPLNQTTSKVAPALAAGCTMVLKPSELAPLDALVLAEIMDDAGVPPGVFNLVNGDGPTVGRALAAHPDVDMISFTGSTRAGVDVARVAAPTVKRVAQELGGKSAVVVLDDADVPAVVRRDVLAAFANAGQSCAAGTRILVPRDRMAAAADAARAAADGAAIGPVVSRAQYQRVQQHIAAGIDEGATLVAGGPGRPDGVEVGYHVRPTVFADVVNDMTIAREEIFGPVVVLIAYDDEDDAVAIANDSEYGLSGYVSSASHDRAIAVARRLRTGMVHVNGAPPDTNAPFGGYKRSGNGREWGAAGLREFLETKSIFGHAAGRGETG